MLNLNVLLYRSLHISNFKYTCSNFSSEQLYVLGGKKHSLASGHILAGVCVVSVSCASSAGSPVVSHISPTLELLRWAPLALSEPLWGGRCRLAVGKVSK